MAQCFTRGHKYPRTTYWRDYAAPDPKVYKQPLPFRLEPDKNGRPGCPDARPYPKSIIQTAAMQYNPPEFDVRREDKMDEMLQCINHCNWVTGQDVRVFGQRKAKLSDMLSYNMQSSYRSTYINHKLAAEPRINPENKVREGIVPELYPVPYKRPECHPLVSRCYYPELKSDPNVMCGRYTVPVHIPHTYPGLPVPDFRTYKEPEKKTTTKMGWALDKL